MVAKIKDLHYECCCHTPYSPELAPSDFNVVGTPKEELSERKFRYNAEVQETVHDWLCKQPTDYFSRGIQGLVKYLNKCIECNADYVEK
jgi:histone-lysine N-methyltransferase SETMAR